MNMNTREALAEYIQALEYELKDLAPSDRAELVLEVRTHLEEARSAMPEAGATELRNIFERLGSPAEIAAEARQRFGVSSGPAGPPAALVSARSVGMLEIATLVAWVIWWPIGILLTALSPRWSRRDKAIAILIEILFFALLASYFVTPTYFGAGQVSTHVIWLVFLAVLPPSLHGVFSAAYLSWRLAHQNRAMKSAR